MADSELEMDIIDAPEHALPITGDITNDSLPISVDISMIEVDQQ